MATEGQISSKAKCKFQFGQVMDLELIKLELIPQLFLKFDSNE